jgi:hypothetical protein
MISRGKGALGFGSATNITQDQATSSYLVVLSRRHWDDELLPAESRAKEGVRSPKPCSQRCGYGSPRQPLHSQRSSQVRHTYAQCRRPLPICRQGARLVQVLFHTLRWLSQRGFSQGSTIPLPSQESPALSLVPRRQRFRPRRWQAQLKLD